jgi:gas vesicle protein
VKSGETGEIDSEEIERAVAEPVDEMKNELTSLRNDVVKTQRVLESMGDDEDQIMNVAMGLHDLVPKVKTVEDAMDGSDSGRVSDLGDRFKREVNEGVRNSDIKIALARLENDVPQVQSQMIEGERIYYEQK